MGTLTRLPKDVLRLIVCSVSAKDILALRKVSAVFWRWTNADFGRPLCSHYFSPRGPKEEPYCMVHNPTPGAPYQTAWVPAFSDLSFPSISTPPYWRTAASIEAYSATELWKDPARVLRICASVSELLFEEPMLYRLRSPITVFGDVHGHFEQFAQLLLYCGGPAEAPMLFLGDYVNRGYFSVKTLILLFLFKIKYPSRVTLLRGQHENRQICEVYGLSDDCQGMYGARNGTRVFRAFVKVFAMMGVAAVIDKRFFCMHAGLPATNTKLEDIQAYPKQETPHEGMLVDLVWGDIYPEDDNTRWQSTRGPTPDFGRKASEEFLHLNQLCGIIRSCNMQQNGYSWYHCATVLTVFSASNYCHRCGNRGAFARVKPSGEVSVVSYDHIEDPREPTPDRPPIPYFL